MQGKIFRYTDTAQLLETGLQPEDVYQLATYVAADAIATQGEPILFTWCDERHSAAIPLLKRSLPEHLNDRVHTDAVSPYGYAGICLSNPTDFPWDKMLEELMRVASEAGIVSIFIRLHPLFHTWNIPPIPHTEHVLHGSVVHVPLFHPLAELRKHYSSNHRRDLRKLHAEGFTVRINDWDQFAGFKQAYRETMETHLASAYYHFSDAYFDMLHQYPELNTHLFTAHDKEGNLTSGALFLRYNDIVQYHLGGTMHAARSFASSKLIFDTAIAHFHAECCTQLHLGGGLGAAEDALFRFKLGFSPELKRFSTLRIISDPTAYSALCHKNSGEGINPASEYFPLYRART